MARPRRPPNYDDPPTFASQGRCQPDEYVLAHFEYDSTREQLRELAPNAA